MNKTIIIVALSLCVFSLATPVFAFPTLIPAECAGNANLNKDLCDDCPLTVTAEERAAKEAAFNADTGHPKTAKACCCNLSSVEKIAVNVTQIILGVAGSIALLAFVVGGILYMTSGGEPGKVQKATTMLQTSVIGLAIILLSGLIVQTILRKLTGT